MQLITHQLRARWDPIPAGAGVWGALHRLIARKDQRIRLPPYSSFALARSLITPISSEQPMCRRVAEGNMYRLNRAAAALIACASLAGCGEKVIRIPEGRTGNTLVAGAVRAHSPHYRILAAMKPSGGPRNSPGFTLQNGSYVNGKE
jgi:hypothetical protein